jgi:hypothetical protein
VSICQSFYCVQRLNALLPREWWKDLPPTSPWQAANGGRISPRSPPFVFAGASFSENLPFAACKSGERLRFSGPQAAIPRQWWKDFPSGCCPARAMVEEIPPIFECCAALWWKNFPSSSDLSVRGRRAPMRNDQELAILPLLGVQPAEMRRMVEGFPPARLRWRLCLSSLASCCRYYGGRISPF